MPEISPHIPRINNHVQAVLFNRNIYTLSSARRIVSSMGYYDYWYRTTNKYIRFRQFNPGVDKLYNTIDSNKYPGVKFIIEF